MRQAHETFYEFKAVAITWLEKQGYAWRPEGDSFSRIPNVALHMSDGDVGYALHVIERMTESFPHSEQWLERFYDPDLPSRLGKHYEYDRVISEFLAGRRVGDFPERTIPQRDSEIYQYDAEIGI